MYKKNFTYPNVVMERHRQQVLDWHSQLKSLNSATDPSRRFRVEMIIIIRRDDSRVEMIRV